MTSKYPNYQQKIKILEHKLCLYAQQAYFFENVVKGKPSKCICLHEECELLGNLEKTLSVQNIDTGEIVNKIILHLFNLHRPNSFLQANQIKILAIKKIQFLNFLKITVSITDSSNNILNFLDEIIRLKKFIIVKNFTWKFFSDLTNHCKKILCFHL